MLYSYICLFALSLAFYRRRENISFYVINMFVIKWRQTRWCLFFSHSLLYVLYNHDRKMYELVFVVSVLYPVSIKQLRVEYWFDVLWIYSRYNELQTRKGTNPPGNMSVCVCVSSDLTGMFWWWCWWTDILIVYVVWYMDLISLWNYFHHHQQPATTTTIKLVWINEWMHDVNNF